MALRSRLTLPGARPAASVPKPPPPRPPRPPAEPPRPAAKAPPEAKRTPEQAQAALEADREAAVRHHRDLFSEAERALAERVLAGGTARVGREGRRHLARWAELTGRRVWIGAKPWRNPFRPWLAEGRRPTAAELAESHARYREHVLGSPALMARLRGLKGKVLACSCPPGAPCHGDVLVELLEGLEHA